MDAKEIAKRNEQFVRDALEFEGIDLDAVDSPSEEQTMSPDEIHKVLDSGEAKLPRGYRG